MEYLKTYHLIQQTPLIHFQHDQHGATLRASEVKPKLDKFIIKKMGDKIPKNWFIDDTQALNYKMRIVAEGELSYVNLGIKTDYDIFYGNMNDKSSSAKKGVCGNCKIEIVCFIQKLQDYITEIINDFFIVANFGTMQNKGFGSYLVNGTDKSSNNILRCLNEAYKVEKLYFFSEDNTQYDQRFKDIKTLYSVMKSGLNHNDYHRSYLFEYCHNELQIGNEKAAMKKEAVSPYADGEPVKHPLNKKNFWDYGSHKTKYVRALLGVGDHIEYITGFYWDSNRKRYLPEREKATIRISNSQIERLASPIRFKIIGNTVYMYAIEINDNIFNQKFTFENTKAQKSITIFTPEKGEFDINKFLEWFVEKYNYDSQQKNRKGNYVSYSIKKQIKYITCKGDALSNE